ncbi:hypothetical protein ElyMa_006864600 [Elysia marginata]|uniref:Uncharacterized protein n=1 Tax=Elysia marginata TaxID=1093978 RepID=A0AAV4J9L4_9GAST|nr:hypothetical protein ElyMa_006864600 [Elysia marginata]
MTVRHIADQNDIVKRNNTLAMIEDTFPAKSWIYVYKNGSATDAVTDVKADTVIFTPGGENFEFNKATGNYCSSYFAKTQALIFAIDRIEDCRGDHQQIVIFTEAKSVLEALQVDILPDFTRKLKLLLLSH